MQTDTPPPPEPTPVAAAPPDAAPSPEPVPPAPVEIELTVTIDPSLREPNSPEPPADSIPQTIAVDKSVALIGRRSETRAIFPEIALDLDTAVSHRHAILSRSADGSVTLRDIGSANGTRLNNRDLPPMTDVAIHDGDQVTLGHWTRIIVKAKS
jgi:pSer/pThr/pTyr-binding forkhead associated (FHA) protein